MNEKPGPNGQEEHRPDAALSTVEEPTLVLESAEAVREPAEPPAPAGPTPSPTKRRGVPRLVVAAAAVLLVGGAAVAVALLVRRQPERVVAPTESPSVLADPIALQTDAQAFRVVLRWIQPSGGTPVKGYDVYRNGRYLERVEAPATTFTDDDALPAKRYEYEVQAFSGPTMSAPVTVTTRTSRAPLGVARVEGTFDVKARTESSYGYIDFDDRHNYGWKFFPRCDEGPCNVVWKFLNSGVRSKVDRHGARYSGSYHGYFHVHCGEARTASDVTLQLHVAKAKSVFGGWRAVKLVGTLKHSEPAQLGCVSSSATLAFTARLVH